MVLPENEIQAIFTIFCVVTNIIIGTFIQF